MLSHRALGYHPRAPSASRDHRGMQDSARSCANFLATSVRRVGHCTSTVFATVVIGPSNAGTTACRSVRAMQLPVSVPANGGPLITAAVTRPVGAKLTTARATPLGSVPRRQVEAARAL